MERFPLEHNVVWANYTDIGYTTLLENKFGKGQIDPVIPFLLQKYVKAGTLVLELLYSATKFMKFVDLIL
jgi:hypothetical protein